MDGSTTSSDSEQVCQQPHDPQPPRSLNAASVMPRQSGREAASVRLKTTLGRMASLMGGYGPRFRSQMVIVAFHRITDEIAQDGITCGSAKFERFCEFFREYFRVVPLSEQVAGCREWRDMGGTLSITFDDGYRDNVEVAAPILRKFGLPATFFVATAFIGSDHVPAWDRHLSRRPGWMTWDHLRALRDQGFEIGAHTHSHADLARLDPDSVREDLFACRQNLTRELGTFASLFAYPFGGRNNISTTSRQLVREAGFECCLACFGGVNPPIADPFHLNRIGIGQWFATPHQLGFELMTYRA